jgi:GNAT superfamily N-acetyltransferase
MIPIERNVVDRINNFYIRITLIRITGRYTMSIEIKKLTTELTEDYITFFDQVAFTDNDEWAGCYCLFYHWNDVLEEEQKNNITCDSTCYRKHLARDFIEAQKLQGYLAYENGSVVGWVNANDKTAYNRLSPDQWPEIWEAEISKDRIKSIVCYTIAPEQRRKGIATKLLERVCQDAKEQGYSYVEAYPANHADNVVLNYHGPSTLYEKCGFTQYKDIGDYMIFRKFLPSSYNGKY